MITSVRVNPPSRPGCDVRSLGHVVTTVTASGAPSGAPRKASARRGCGPYLHLNHPAPAGTEVWRSPAPLVTPSVSGVSVDRQPLVDEEPRPPSRWTGPRRRRCGPESRTEPDERGRRRARPHDRCRRGFRLPRPGRTASRCPPRPSSRQRRATGSRRGRDAGDGCSGRRRLQPRIRQGDARARRRKGIPALVAIVTARPRRGRS